MSNYSLSDEDTRLLERAKREEASGLRLLRLAAIIIANVALALAVVALWDHYNLLLECLGVS